MSSCASFLHLNELFESSSSRADHIEASEKYEFKAKNKVISTRLKSQGLRRKHIEQCGNIIPQVGIYVEHCGNLFAQVWESHSREFYEVKLGKQCIALRRNSSAQVGIYAEQHGDFFALFGKYTKQRRNLSAQVWESHSREFYEVKLGKQCVALRRNSSAQVGMFTKQHGNIIRHLDRLGDQTVIEPVEITAACSRQQIT